jgi:hypothetical protein
MRLSQHLQEHSIQRQSLPDADPEPPSLILSERERRGPRGAAGVQPRAARYSSPELWVYTDGSLAPGLAVLYCGAAW